MADLVSRVLDAFFEYQEIRDGCEADSNDASRPVYLKRWFIVKGYDPNRSAGVFHVPRWNLTWHRNTEGVQVYLHCIMRSDADRELHDHPWSFASLILWRGYEEETEIPLGCPPGLGPTWLNRKWPGMVLVRRATHRHRVLLTGGPAWTLVLTSRKKRSWGFWRDGVFIPWRFFIARKCQGDSNG